MGNKINLFSRIKNIQTDNLLASLFGLIYMGKYWIFGFIACFSKLCCLFAVVQTLSVPNFDSSNIVISSFCFY